jgi:PPOX class probable F420-dependent enzyme
MTYRLDVAITDEKYVLLTTFRKNGDAVSIPVWIVGMPDGTGGFTTEADTGKVKRIRNNPSVSLQPCGILGKIRPGSAAVSASAEILLGPDYGPVLAAVRRKYRVGVMRLGVVDLFRKVLRRPKKEECAIALRFD